MAHPVRHLLAQGRVLAALGGTVAEAAAQRLGLTHPGPASTDGLPGPEFQARVPVPPASLVRDFVRHVGGDPSAYRGQLPPHMFPQWAVPLAARTLRGLPYPMLKVVNGGCRLQMNAPLPDRGELLVRARLQAVESDGRRAILHQRVVTGTDAVADALVADLFVIVPLGAGAPAGAAPAGSSASAGRGAKFNLPARKAAARVPADARELGFWRLGPDAGLTFALLTGDINPIHWVGPYARAAGFRSPILHGFSTLARAMEGLTRARFAGSVHRWASVDVRFTRPLALPARVGLYLAGQDFFVGDARGGPAYLTGSFSERPS